MRTLFTSTAAAALGVDRKTLDNVLTREAKELLPPGSRGRARKIPVEVLERVAIALILNRDLGVSIGHALALASRISEGKNGTAAAGSLTTVLFDLAELRRALAGAIDDALEGVAHAPRGRPRKQGAK